MCVGITLLGIDVVVVVVGLGDHHLVGCGALHIVVVTLVLASLIARVVSRSLILATIVLVALSLDTVIVEAICTTLSPSVVAMAGQRAWVSVLDAIGSPVVIVIAICAVTITIPVVGSSIVAIGSTIIVVVPASSALVPYPG